MKIAFQGENVETQAGTVGELLSERGCDAKSSLVELDGEVLSPGADSAAKALHEGARVDVFKLVAGG